MAYANYLASVEWLQIVGLRRGLKKRITPLAVATASHLLPGVFKQDPLSSYISELMDGGETMEPSFWHPLRVPIVHSPDAAILLASKIMGRVNELDMRELDPFGELTGILRVLNDANRNSQAVVSVLEPPADKERARKVLCPFDEPEKLPIPWGNLSRIFEVRNKS